VLPVPRAPENMLVPLELEPDLVLNDKLGNAFSTASNAPAANVGCKFNVGTAAKHPKPKTSQNQFTF
jgi:hypothetical protein